jgi:hypothetical protein
MTILLLALAVTFAAFCIWLSVRIVNRRERWAKWALTGLIVLPVLYVASFGPACWISSRATKCVPIVETACSPMMFICDVSPNFVVQFIQWYSGIGASGRWYWGMEGNWIRDESATPGIR